MSLILDALNRAERERHKHQPVPDLNTHHEPPPLLPVAPVSTGRSGIVWLWGAGALLVLVAAIGWWFKASTTPTADKPVSVAAVPVTQSAPAIESVPVALTADVQPAAPSPAVSEVAAPTDQPVAGELEKLYAQAREPEPVQPPTSDPVVSERPEQSLYVPDASPVTHSVPSAPQQPVERHYDSLVDLPDLGDLPWGLRQEIPTLNYSRHNHDVAGQASVVINGQAYRTGQALARDLHLEDIYSDGVILRFRQIRFKLRALNSWINM